MEKRIQAIRGMHDVLPDQTPLWQYVEEKLKHVVQSYGYQEIRFPTLEYTDLFCRGVGEITDIVQKEMYTFVDRNGDRVTLRPEGTAGCVRAGIENGLLHNQVQRLWYMGPLFRHERPQKGRYRQFHQLGVEAFGMATPEIDAEMILMAARMWNVLGLSDTINLQINSLGSFETRQKYREQLVNYFSKYLDQLDEEHQTRLKLNPLRILDSKNPDLKNLISAAPKLLEVLTAEDKKHFQRFCDLLDAAKISYTVNPYLVRGLDYYTHTVFEWVTDKLGAQGTVCAGGRFDALVEMLGGKATPAVGFALGLERLISLLSELKLVPVLKSPWNIYFITSENEKVRSQALLLAERIRNEIKEINLVMDAVGGNMKNQFKRADKSQARLALILGESELENDTISVKYLRDDQPQQSLKTSEMISFLKKYFTRIADFRSESSDS